MTPQARIRSIFAHPRAFATTLLVLLLDLYGPEALEWHPDTIRLQLAEDHGVTLPPASLDRLMAAITIVTTDYFYQSLSRFVDLCNVLSGDGFDPGTFNPADASECAWGITEAALLSPPEGEDPFCEDIRHYVAAVLKDEGFVTPPDVLKIALDADFSARVTYDHADDPELFAAVYQTQQSKTAELTESLRGTLQDLATQLASLPLQHGSVKELLAKLPAHLRPEALTQE